MVQRGMFFKHTKCLHKFKATKFYCDLITTVFIFLIESHTSYTVWKMTSFWTSWISHWYTPNTFSRNLRLDLTQNYEAYRLFFQQQSLLLNCTSFTSLDGTNCATIELYVSDVIDYIHAYVQLFSCVREISSGEALIHSCRTQVQGSEVAVGQLT